MGGAILAITWQGATAALADDREHTSWKVTDPFSACAKDCSIALLAGKTVSLTPMTSVFIHFQSPGTWQWDNTYIATLSASRTLVRYGNYFSIDPEIGVGRYFGDAYGTEAWLALYLDGGISPGTTMREPASVWASAPALPTTSVWIPAA